MSWSDIGLIVTPLVTFILGICVGYKYYRRKQAKVILDLMMLITEGGLLLAKAEREIAEKKRMIKILKGQNNG
jgi:hypothetical protein